MMLEGQWHKLIFHVNEPIMLDGQCHKLMLQAMGLMECLMVNGVKLMLKGYVLKECLTVNGIHLKDMPSS